MSKFTVREFAEKIGLSEDHKDYVGAGVMLKLFKIKGLATETKRQGSRGRPSLVYDVSKSVFDLLKIPAVSKPDLIVGQKVVEAKVVEAKMASMETAAPQTVTVGSLYHWEEDDE